MIQAQHELELILSYSRHGSTPNFKEKCNFYSTLLGTMMKCRSEKAITKSKVNELNQFQVEKMEMKLIKFFSQLKDILKKKCVDDMTKSELKKLLLLSISHGKYGCKRMCVNNDSMEMIIRKTKEEIEVLKKEIIKLSLRNEFLQEEKISKSMEMKELQIKNINHRKSASKMKRSLKLLIDSRINQNVSKENGNYKMKEELGMLKRKVNRLNYLINKKNMDVKDLALRVSMERDYQSYFLGEVIEKEKYDSDHVKKLIKSINSLKKDLMNQRKLIMLICDNLKFKKKSCQLM